MSKTIAILAPGAMGSAVARRLSENGARVLTSLKGRSEATLKRAADAGMVGAEDAAIADADIILSIVPPGEAVALAERLAALIVRREKKPVVVDCNAVNVDTVLRIEEIIGSAQAPFVDAGIIGFPPQPGGKSPAFYMSGEHAGDVAMLKDFGLDVRIVEGPVGAASALKMSYAGINKGTQAIGAAMMLAAMRAGSADALYDELSFSQKEMLAQFKQQLPKMPAKAYRWIAEMQEIAGFVADDPAARDLYEGAARFYQKMAEDFSGGQKAADALESFLTKDVKR